MMEPRRVTVLAAALAAAVALAGACGGETSGGGGGNGGGNGVGLGGAQDIGAFRAILDDGEIPGESTLDANGFFSEHYSELPPADCGGPLCLVGRIAVGQSWTGGPDQAVLQVVLSTPLDPSELERKPLDLVAVIDTSGSMAEQDRIGYARTGLHALIDEMDPGDRLAIVSFSDEVAVPAGLQEVGDGAALHAAVDQLAATGATNLHDGLERGFQLGLEAFDPARQDRVILVSDGLATIGITDDAAIQSMADRYLSDGIGLTTVGVGLDFDVELLRGLAERGAGNFYFLEEPAAISEVFREELDTSVTPIALDVQLSVAAEAGWRIGDVIGTHYWAGSDRSGEVQLPAVFMASRESDQPGEYGRRGAGGAIFLSMVPTEGTVWDPSDALAAVRLTYRLPGGEERLETRLDVDSRPDADSPGEAYLGDESMAEHYAMYNVFVGLRAATREAEYGSYSCALGVLERLDSSAARWQAEFADEDLEADRAIIARFADNLRARGATSAEQCGYEESYEEYPAYCQAGGSAATGAASWGLIGIALALAIGRRRGRRGGA
ncbi:MAG TPA: VWA domain-containing protein [Kofleriaceae bacterium]|nr:VWA domain-containing protein [Kofleriaceae bacterium]